MLTDTLFMEQSMQLLSEVVVSPAGEPAWIKPMLMKFVKEKNESGVTWRKEIWNELMRYV